MVPENGEKEGMKSGEKRLRDALSVIGATTEKVEGLIDQCLDSYKQAKPKLGWSNPSEGSIPRAGQAEGRTPGYGKDGDGHALSWALTKKAKARIKPLYENTDHHRRCFADPSFGMCHQASPESLLPVRQDRLRPSKRQFLLTLKRKPRPGRKFDAGGC